VSTQGKDEYESPSLQMLMRRSWEQPTVADWTEVIGALPLFSQLGKRQVRRLARLATVVDYSPDEEIVRAGERGDSFYLLLEGQATAIGRSSRLAPGDFFGEMALIDGSPRSATITALTTVRAMKLPRRGFITALEQDVRIGLAIMAVLAGRIRALEQSPSS
jgi:CRP/FNR family transcriptional regulator, cyclic AMP receptor protein